MNSISVAPCSIINLDAIRNFSEFGNREVNSNKFGGMDMVSNLMNASPKPCHSPLSSTETFKPDNLFENFLVIGTTKEIISEFFTSGSKYVQKLKEYEEINFPGEVLYNFAKSANIEHKVNLPGIEKFIAPCGIPVSNYKKKLTRGRLHLQRGHLQGKKEVQKEVHLPL